MEQKFKLKKAARQFFDTKEHTSVETMKYWKKNGIHENLLEEVSNAYLTYGHTYKSVSGTEWGSLSGWGGDDKEAHFHFTVNFSDIEYKEYDKLDVAKLSDEIQNAVDIFCKKYLQP